jgi:hypothetical protein
VLSGGQTLEGAESALGLSGDDQIAKS